MGLKKNKKNKKTKRKRKGGGELDEPGRHATPEYIHAIADNLSSIAN